MGYVNYYSAKENLRYNCLGAHLIFFAPKNSWVIPAKLYKEKLEKSEVLTVMFNRLHTINTKH